MTVFTHEIGVRAEADGRIVFISVTGKLKRSDYQRFVPVVDEGIEKFGKVRLLVDLVGFQGWNAGSLWEDLKFTFQHYSGLDRVAVIGDRKWEKGMATFGKVFTKAEVRYFDLSESEAARLWIREGILEA